MDLPIGHFTLEAGMDLPLRKWFLLQSEHLIQVQEATETVFWLF